MAWESNWRASPRARSSCSPLLASRWPLPGTWDVERRKQLGELLSLRFPMDHRAGWGSLGSSVSVRAVAATSLNELLPFSRFLLFFDAQQLTGAGWKGCGLLGVYPFP